MKAYSVKTKHQHLDRLSGVHTVNVYQDAYYKTFYAVSDQFGCGKNYKTEIGAISGLINASGAYIIDTREV